MRLTPEEVAAIKAAAAEAFGPDAVVRLFGSRVRDDLKGGDVDLLIDVDPERATYRHQGRFLDYLFKRIDPRKVDVLLAPRGREPGAFERLVRPQSVELT